MRNLRLLPTCLIVAAGVFPVLVACGGKEVSLGTNKAQLALVDPTAVSGTVPACNSGDAHPNVCCQAVAGQAGSCGVYPGAPFQPCESGWTAYPDPRSCCALDDPSSCASPPTTAPPSPPGSCGYTCEPGWYPIQNGCCQATNGPDGVCYGWASGGDAGVVDGGVVDGGVADGGDPIVDGSACGAFNIDGGIECSVAHVINGHCYMIGCGPAFGNGSQACDCSVDHFAPPMSTPAAQNVCDPTVFDQAWSSVCNFPAYDSPPPTVDAGAGTPTGSCDYACPSGWQRASGAPDVCCRDLGGGEFECFSQATGPSSGGGSTEPDGGVDDGGPVEVDAGFADAEADAGTMICGGSNNGECTCQQTVNGHTYEVDCSDSAHTCTCILDGVGTTTTGVTECSNPDGSAVGVQTFWTDTCHFPN